MPALIALLLALPRIAAIALPTARAIQRLAANPLTTKLIIRGGQFVAQPSIQREYARLSGILAQHGELLNKIPEVYRTLAGELSDIGQRMIGK